MLADLDLAALGYFAVRTLPPGDADYQGCQAALMRLMYTVAIVVDLDPYCYEDRWCYKSEAEALAALDAWDGRGEPTGWHRHPNSGRRRDEDGNETIYW